MNFTVGQDIEAVDQFGVWHLAKIVDKREGSVVVTFPPFEDAVEQGDLRSF